MADNQITIKQYMAAPEVQKRVKEMLDKRASQFITSVIAIAGQDQLLALCEPRSLFNACLDAASMDLPINKNLGMAHIIGYKNNKKGGIVEAQMQIGWKGFVQLAERSNLYKTINVTDIREGEMKGNNRLTGKIDFAWEEDSEKRLKLPIVGYVSFFELLGGFEKMLYMSTTDLIAHGKKYSQSYKAGYGPWVDNFDAMARKTVVKLLINNWGPKSIEMQKALAIDQAVVKDDGVEYVDGVELTDVGADDDKKAAIIAANSEDSETSNDADVEPDTSDPTDEEVEQATLIPKEEKKSDNRSRRSHPGQS
jgi:recombination protein RecT